MGVGPRWSCSPMTEAVNFLDSSPNPNPRRFEILDTEYHNGNTILLVHYPDCTTFEGQKLLLLKGVHALFTELDPHFLDDDHPVIARFIPNEDGYKMALASAKAF
jgi:hypothetical protein